MSRPIAPAYWTRQRGKGKKWKMPGLPGIPKYLTGVLPKRPPLLSPEVSKAIRNLVKKYTTKGGITPFSFLAPMVLPMVGTILSKLLPFGKGGKNSAKALQLERELQALGIDTRQ
jgi:hypothetical protein